MVEGSTRKILEKSLSPAESKISPPHQQRDAHSGLPQPPSVSILGASNRKQSQ